MACNFPKKRQTLAAKDATMRNKNTDFGPPKEIRIVMVGKTGNGKSASGNTILNLKVFRSLLSPCSVTSECVKARGEVGGSSVALIDTPGMYDTRYKEDDLFKKLKECVSLAAPGPHVFLIVIKLDKFTEEEQQTVELLQMVFGDKAANYSMVLFTHGEQLGRTKIEDFFSQSQPLRSLIKKCNGRYHVFSNTVPRPNQVPELLAKIRDIIRHNQGTFYTNGMFQEAEKLIQQEAEKIMKANAEKKRREEEQLRAKFQGELLQEKIKGLEKTYKKKSREKAEKKNNFIEAGVIMTTVKAGAIIGATAAGPGGPICGAIGTAVGGVAGAIVGVLAPSAVKALRKNCIVQ